MTTLPPGYTDAAPHIPRLRVLLSVDVDALYDVRIALRQAANRLPITLGASIEHGPEARYPYRVGVFGVEPLTESDPPYAIPLPRRTR